MSPPITRRLTAARISIRAALQQQGDNVLAMADGLRRAAPAQLKSGGLIYLDILGRWLPRLPLAWALPLSSWLLPSSRSAGLLTRHESPALRRPLLAALMPALMLAGAVGLGFVLHGAGGMDFRP